MIQITEKQKQEIEEKFTKYEIARILGARALQIAMNAPILIKLEKEELENIAFNSLKIAEIEFYVGVLPITVKRPLPKKAEEKTIKKIIAEEKGEEREKEEKPKEKIKEKLKEKEEERVEEKKPEEAKKPEVEKPEEGTLEEVEQSEIMELATPPDEAEEEAAAEEEAE